MAIQMRRGEYDDFDASKMLAGELAVVVSGDPETEGGALYVATAAGSATRVAFANEIPGDATTTSDGLMSAADKAKLDGVAAGAQANVIESVSVNGNNATVTDKAAAVTIPEATDSASGVMGAGDKAKLDGIEAGANAYTLPAATTATLGGVKPDGTTVIVDNDGTIHAAGSGTIPDGSITGVKIADDTIPDAKLAQTGGVLSTINDVLGIEQIPHTIANGSPVSSSNSWAVHVPEPIDVEYDDLIVVTPLVEPPSGYHFCFGFYAFNDATKVSAFCREWLDNGYSPNYYGVNYTPSSHGVTGVKVGIALVDENNNHSALRADTFGPESVEVVRYRWGHVLDKAESIGLLADFDSGADNLGNYGMFGNNSLSSGNLTANNARIASDHLFSFDRTITLKAASGFRFGVQKFVNGAFSADSGWQTSYTVPANTTFKAIISRVTEDYYERADVSAFVNAVTFETALSERVSALEGYGLPYSYYGAAIDTSKHGYTCTQLGWSQSAPSDTSFGSSQAFAIFGDTLFQCYENGGVQLYDMTDGTKVAEYSIAGEHCDSVDFSNEYYTASDSYPLMYVTADTTPATVYVNRVTTSGATLVRTLKFPAEDTGYYAGHAIDAATNTLYLIGYSENDFQTDQSGTNHMIVSAWNLNSLTDHDTYLTPEKVGSFTLPFIYVTQGQCFFDGKIFVVSSYSSVVQQSRVYVIDPIRKAVVAVLTDFPSTLLNTEMEGVAFHLVSSQYEMVLGTQSAYFAAKFHGGA